MNNFKLTSKRDVSDTVLKWFKEKAVLDNRGKKSLTLESSMDMLYSMAVDELLVWCISSQPLIPEFAKQQAVSQAIDRWLRYKKYKNNPDNTSAYEKALSVGLGNIPQDIEYLVLGFINIRPEGFLLQKPIEVSGSILRFASWSELNNINLGNLWTKAQEYLPKHIASIFADPSRMISTFIPFFIETKSYSKDDAIRKAQKDLNLLRVALNFVSATNLLVRYGEIFPLAKFIESPIWCVINVTKNLTFEAYTDNDIKYIQPQEVSPHEYDAAQNIIERMNEAKGLWRLITNLLSLYQQALDLTDCPEVFLALWRILEAAVLDDPKHPVNIPALVGRLTDVERDPILKHTLDMLSYYRNDLVHDGTFPKRNNIVFLLKKIVDVTLGKMISIAQNVNDENEFQEYLTFLSTNDTDLARKAKVIGLVQSKRKKTAG